MTSFDEYKDSFEFYRLERNDGILEITMHCDGSDMVWSMPADDECGKVFEAVGRDPENKVIILTGTGSTFIHHENLSAGVDSLPASMWPGVIAFASRLLNSHLDIPAPMIAAVNGPATIHAELALLCDIVIASETAVFADQPHFPNGLVPGDGVHVILPMLMGMNRARYAMLTGQVIDAAEAQRIGLVNEVLPRDAVIARARALAAQLMEAPPTTLALTRGVFTAQIKQRLNEQLGFGLAVEGIAAAEYWPRQFKGVDLSD